MEQQQPTDFATAQNSGTPGIDNNDPNGESAYNAAQQQNFTQSMQQQQTTTYGEIKKHKNQVENDVKLLRNRVRMLQMEHEKAQKKVNDTAVKTEELVHLRMKNDMKFQEREFEQQRKQNEQLQGQSFHYQNAKERKKNVQNAKLNMYVKKRQGVQSVRDKLDEDLNRKRMFEEQDRINKEAKRESIRQMAAKGRQKVQDFGANKIGISKADQRARTEQEKKLIYKYEKEAQNLEATEEALIQRLQMLQDEEKNAFQELEQCMVTASLAKKDRLQIVEEVNEEQQYSLQQKEAGVQQK